jgi:ProQ/FINO family
MSRYENFNDLAAALTEAGLLLPKPLRDAIDGDFKPLSLDTREIWPTWGREHGYDEGQVVVLMKAVGRFTRHPSYLDGLATDLSERHDVDGNPVERVKSKDRLAASMLLLQRGMREVKKATTAPVKQPATARPSPVVAGPSTARRPIIGLGGIQRQGGAA